MNASRILFILRCFIILIGLALSWFAGPSLRAVESQISSEAQMLYSEGLKAERGKKWSEAVKLYSRAWEKGDSRAERRSILLFKFLRRQDADLTDLKSVFTAKQREVLNSYEASEGSETFSEDPLYLNPFLQALAALLLASAAVYFWKYRRQKALDAFKNLKEQIGSVQKYFKHKKVESPEVASSAEPKINSVKLPKGTFVSEATKLKIQSMFDTVNTLQNPNTSAPDIDTDGLETSGIIEVFSKELLSEVKSVDSSSGKFSKMTIDAELVFGDDEEQLKNQ